MQIDPTRLSGVPAAPVTPAATPPVAGSQAAPTAAATSSGPADQVSLSRQASEVQAAHVALAQTPEVRTELVEKLKAEIAAGTYRVDADRIAERLIPD